MKRLRLALSGLFFITIAGSCTPGPEKLANQFLTHLKDKRYEDAQAIASPLMKQQVAVIKQDKNALYNGQQWNYENLTTKLTDKTATVFYTVKLGDGSKIKHRALLYKSTNNWLVKSIDNLTITYSPTALRERTYAENGNQMLIAPLDIEYISAEKLTKHVGQFIMVSGNICSYHDKGNTLLMCMGADSSIPLMDVSVTGNAKARAVNDHNRFLKSDYMVESPMGDSFTVIGILSKNRGRFSMLIINPQNIITGPMLRIEKQ